jgi:cytochrome P450
VIEFDPYGAEYTKDPYPFYARLRDEAPVYHNEARNFWALSRYHDIVAAHADDRIFCSSGGVTIEGHEAALPLLIVQDRPAEHFYHQPLGPAMRRRMAGPRGWW